LDTKGESKNKKPNFLKKLGFYCTEVQVSVVESINIKISLHKKKFLILLNKFNENKEFLRARSSMLKI